MPSSLQVLAASTLAAVGVGATRCTVPPLACFGDTPIKKFQYKSVVSDLSGVSYNPDTKTIFAVNNGAAKAYEMDPFSGALVNEWDLPSLDPEGITWVDGRTFVIIDENPATIKKVELHSDGAVKELETIVKGIEPPARENLGFEGVAYNEAYGYLAAQEMSETVVWQFKDGARKMVSNLKDQGFLMLGELASSCSAADEYFLISKEPKAILRMDLASGLVKETYAGAVCDMGQPEGLTFAEIDGKTYMMVVGEPIEALIFEADPSCTAAIGATEGLMKECPVREIAVGGCEKTLEDGGCPLKRCNKVLTPHNKICTDTEPGVTDCSLEECQAHCVASVDFECSHFSWDEKERECYIFDGCVDMQFDADYVQYAMVDPTCERTLEDYPDGCEQRRCSKTKNKNEKICAAKSGTACTKEECQQKCIEHTDFTCTTFSLDPSNGDCYVWETCDEEGDEPDYNTWVLVDPTCEKTMAEGGCPQRLCDFDANQGTQVCSGMVLGGPATPCDAEECSAKCLSTPGCAFFAHDPTDMDCQLFEDCLGESFSDDFITYKVDAADVATEELQCTATVAEGGCPKLRCAKADNPNEKICENGNPAPNGACTMDECQAKCAAHTEFECTHFSYDPVEGDCYIWSGCLGLGEEPEYDTFAVAMGQACTDSKTGMPCTPGSRRLLFGSTCMC